MHSVRVEYMIIFCKIWIILHFWKIMSKEMCYQKTSEILEANSRIFYGLNIIFESYFRSVKSSYIILENHKNMKISNNHI